jgi:hypothetical protein
MSGYSFACGVRSLDLANPRQKNSSPSAEVNLSKSIMPASPDRKLMRFAAMAASYRLDRRRGEQGYKYRSASVFVAAVEKDELLGAASSDKRFEHIGSTFPDWAGASLVCQPDAPHESCSR